MKKIKLDVGKLNLNKQRIVDLNPSALSSGFTGGCTDGQFCHSAWNCTNADCSNDCPIFLSKLACPSPETTVQTKYCLNANTGVLNAKQINLEKRNRNF